MLGKATGIAKEHSISKISDVMIVGKFKIMRSGPKAVTVVCLGRRGWIMWSGLRLMLLNSVSSASISWTIVAWSAGYNCGAHVVGSLRDAVRCTGETPPGAGRICKFCNNYGTVNEL